MYNPIRFVNKNQELYNPIRFVEIWKDINCFDIKPDTYEISTFGNIRQKNTNELLNPKIQGNVPYKRIILKKYNEKTASFLLHRIVAKEFIYNINEAKTQVNHKNSDKLYNNFFNLEWVTPLENTHHSMESGTFLFCEEKPNSKFTNKQVHLICKLLEEGKSYKDILMILEMELTKNNFELIGYIKRGISYIKNIRAI